MTEPAKLTDAEKIAKKARKKAKRLEADRLEAQRRVKLYVGIGAAVVVVWFILGHWPSWTSPKLLAAGNFGDSFGVVNSLFAGLAFAGVIVAIWLQSQELKLQREELRMTRRELSKQAKAQQASEAALRRQAKVLFYAAYLNALDGVWQAARRRIDGDYVEVPASLSAYRAAYSARTVEIQVNQLLKRLAEDSEVAIPNVAVRGSELWRMERLCDCLEQTKKLTEESIESTDDGFLNVAINRLMGIISGIAEAEFGLNPATSTARAIKQVAVGWSDRLNTGQVTDANLTENCSLLAKNIIGVLGQAVHRID